MQTDPARVRRTDPGDPEKCPVWQLHQVYSNEETKAWVVAGCTSAGIGCLDCKQPVIDAIIARAGAVARARRAVPREPEARALDRRGRHRAGAHRRARDHARSARRDGAFLLVTGRVAVHERGECRDGSAPRRVRSRAGAATAAALRPIRLSVPANRRLMLPLWRQIISPAITRSASAIASGPSVRTCQKGANTAETIDASDE